MAFGLNEWFYFISFQIPQAVTFLQDALKTFEAEGWTELQLKTLRDLSDCYRKLGEHEKLGRALVQMASIAEEKGTPLNDFLTLVPKLGIVPKLKFWFNCSFLATRNISIMPMSTNVVIAE